MTVRIQDDDMKRLASLGKASGRTVSEIVRVLLRGADLKNVKVDHKYNLDLIRQLNKIGNNINQSAHSANTSKALDIEILQRLAQIEDQLRQLYDRETGQSTQEHEGD